MAKCGDGSLALLNAGNRGIGTDKTSDLPKQLESRQLTTSEDDIIMKRVELQRQMLEEYDKRDKARKANDIREVCPYVTEQEALKALEMCSNRENEAAARLVEPPFLRRVRAALGVSNSVGPGHAAGTKRAKPTDPAGYHNGVFFGTFRGRGFPASALSRPASAEQPEEPEQGCAELAALVAQSLAERRGQAERFAGAVSSESHPTGAALGSGEVRAGVGRDAVTPRRPGSAQSAQSAAQKCQSAAEMCQAAAKETPVATESPIASSPQPYGLMRELGDGTCRPCTTSEVAALTGEEPPTRSPSVNPVRPLRVPVRPALSPLGRPNLAAAPGPLVEARSAADLQDTSRQPREAPEASATQPVLQEFGGPDEAAGPDQQSMQPCGNRDKENDAARNERVKASTARTAAAALGRAQQASSEDTVTISSLGAGEDTETDDDSAPARKRRNVQRPGSSGAGAYSRAQAARMTAPLSDIKRPGSKGDVDPHHAARAGQKRAASGHRSAPPRRTASAISKSGHTRAGRVRQKSHKQAEMVSAGKLRAEAGWFNSGYIFSEGFMSRVNFRSSVVLSALCVHECSILGEEGQFWPAATFRVTSMDRADEPLYAKSCTGCWSQVLKRINAEIEARRAAGEDLPPPPKTAIAGPEYFGLNQLEVMEAIEALDRGHLCTDYWAGKHEREAASAGLPVPSRAGAGRPAAGPRRRGSKRSTRAGSDSYSDEDEESEEGAGNRWSALLRQARYKKRYEADAENGEYVDMDNPLPDFTDPITLQPVVNPAISSHGHVMGLQTWKAVLADSGLCPLTKQPLRWEALTVLTHGNIERYRALIRNAS